MTGRNSRPDWIALGREVMIRAPKYARPTQRVAEILDITEGRAITVLPVLDQDDKVLGIVHLHDLLGKGHLRFTAGEGSFFSRRERDQGLGSFSCWHSMSRRCWAS